MNFPQTYQPGSTDPNSTNRPQHPLANYQFSSEELRVIRECNTESFFQRSLPFGTGFGLAAYFGVKHGYLQPNLKFGPIPKVLLGVVFGYFIGKFSYQQKCAEKIMRLPNSKLADVLRQKQKGGLYGVLNQEQDIGTGLGLSTFAPSSADLYSAEYSKNVKSNSLILDPEGRPSMSGLDDTFRPSVDDPSPQFENDLPIVAPKQSVTYDELRIKNREEYLKKSQSPYSRPLPAEAPIVKRSQEIGGNINEQDPEQLGKKNKYGDTWSN